MATSRTATITTINGRRTGRHPLWSLIIVSGLGILIVFVKVLVSH